MQERMPADVRDVFWKRRLMGEDRRVVQGTRQYCAVRLRIEARDF